MSHRCWNSVLLDNSNLPIAILHLLLEKRSKRFAGMIPALNAGRLPDLATSSCETQVEFIVFASDQLLVEEANPVKNIYRPAAEVNCIQWSFVIRLVRKGASNRKGRLRRCRNCLTY